ncbi:MAG: class I SAM-dependent methyltransferase [Pseudomonadota bacterium]
MKNVVFNETGREIEFKPDEIFDKYLKLTRTDLSQRFKDGQQLVQINCPGCLSDKTAKAFDKFGFQYVECQVCQTVYMSPCPQDKDIKDHYLNSLSSHYWRENLTKATEDTRKEKIYSMRLQWILDVTGEYLPGAKVFADFRNMDRDYMRVFLKASCFDKKVVVDPYFDLNEIAIDQNNTQVLPDLQSAEKLKEKVDVATAFEVLDSTSDVEMLLKTIKNVLAPGGLCFITTISISGFDLQVLWGDSKTIFPVDRIKLLSSEGLKILFKRHGFEMLEYSTPGVLDLDIVKNAVERNGKLSVSRFVKTLIKKDDEQLNKDFQEFLQINKLSSFVRVVLRKK